MDEWAIFNPRRDRREANRGAMLSLVPWPALVPFPEDAWLGAEAQKEAGPHSRALMEEKNPFAPEPHPISEGAPAAEPEAPAQPDAPSPAAGGATPPVAPAAARAADAWTKVAVRASRGRFPASVRAIAEQMLIEGASPEEVVQAAHDRGLVRLKRDTVQRWLDENPELSEQALRRQAETAEALRRSLAADLGSPEARLAEAALFAGLSRTRKRASFLGAARQAALDGVTRQQLESENRVLRRRAERLEQRTRSITRRVIRARLRLERMRWKLFERQVSRLYTETEGAVGDDFLVPELLKELRKLRRVTAGKRKKAAGPDAA